VKTFCNMSLLTVKNLTVEYHTDNGVFRAVESLNFHLDQGRSLGIVGESGCGKTTAMLALMRLLPEAGRIVGGEVILDGTDLLSMSTEELRRYRWARISMIFQSAMNALNPVYPVGKQIEDTLLLHHTVSRKMTKKAVARLLDLVGVSSSRANQYPHEYSGGMRQRAMIAMALACNPQIVIADEPTTALDVMVQAQILDLLKELQRELNLSIILVTHDLGVVAEICDDVLVMYGGQLAEYADTDTIYNHAVHPYTRRLLVAFPDIQNPEAELASIPGYPPPLDNLPPGCRFAPRCNVSVDKCSRINPPEIEINPGHLARCILVKDYRTLGIPGE
jgi:peptide/nickel transport system ATP-binding protein